MLRRAPHSRFHRIAIGEREVNLRIILDFFRIHHFVAWSISKYLISHGVLVYLMGRDLYSIGPGEGGLRFALRAKWIFVMKVKTECR